MKERCANTNHSCYKNYGGRGIKVYKRWQDFESFYADMGDPPLGLTLERIDNDLGYCKENCCWATRRQQQLNQRRNRLLTYNGKTQPIAVWAEEIGMPWGRLRDRIDVLGWTLSEALQTGRYLSYKSSKLQETDIPFIRRSYQKGQSGHTARDIAEQFGVSDQTIYDVVRHRGRWAHLP